LTDALFLYRTVKQNEALFYIKAINYSMILDFTAHNLKKKKTSNILNHGVDLNRFYYFINFYTEYM